jgi:DNA-binding transcriptional LysR family regulator
VLDVKRLTLLRELELRGSIAATSRVLGISSSAISQQLTKLEAEVGLVLLEQVGRNVRLTPSALQLVRRVEEVVTILEDAEAALESRRSQIQGVVRFAGFSTFARRYLPEVLRRMAVTHPDVVVEFTQLEPVEALDTVASRRADIAVIDEFPHTPRRADPGMVRTLLMRDRIAVYTPRPVSSVEELAALPWAFEPVGSDASVWARRTCREFGFEPTVLYDSPDPRVHYELVMAGVSAAFLPDMVLDHPAVTSERMERWEPRPQSLEQEMHRNVYAVIRRGGQARPAFASFLQILREVAAE